MRRLLGVKRMEKGFFGEVKVETVCMEQELALLAR
jgi:hypothetical protein